MYSEEHKRYLKREKNKKQLITFFKIAIIVIFLLVWEFAARFEIINPFLSSYPTKVITTAIDLYTQNNLMSHILVTLYETLISFSLASVIGLLIASILWSNKTISKILDPYLTVLNSFYKYLLFMGKCSINPCDGIKHPKLSKKLPEYLTSEEINKLFDIRLTKPIDYRNKAMLEVLYATGTRISELINLELNQIDFDECIIRVTGKGKKDRIIPIGDTAMDALKNYILNYRIFLVKTNDNNYVFLNKNGNKISRQGFFKILKGLAFDAGIKKDISPHTIRHSFATNLLNNGADLRIIQELLGHENLQTTEIYSHLTNKKIEDDYQNHPHANN